MATDQQQSTETHVPEKEKPPFSIQGSENTLCRLCSEALIIDDARAGGSIQKSPDGTTSALDFSGFATNEWNSYSGSGYYSELQKDKWKKIDQLGWQPDNCPGDREYFRYCVANTGCDRSVKPPDLPELSACVAGGCQLCHRLKQLFIERYKKKPWWQAPSSSIRFRIRYAWLGERSRQDTRYSLRNLAVDVCHPGHDDKHADMFTFAVGAWPGKCRDWLRISRYPLDNEGPLSARNLDLVNTWIKDCAANHDRCNAKRSQADFLPTRLLDLDVETITDHIVLIDTIGLPLQNGQYGFMYAALSYCWGSSVPMKTTSASLASHQERISVSNMPQAFQDAVLVARKLKILYLWIDALCIIQDSPMDWEQESGKMSDIFAHAFITIGAATSTACDQSFVDRSRAPTLRIPFQSSLDPDISGDYTIFLDGDHVCPAEVDMHASRWNSRAWVWQEQELSAKMLVFGRRMLQLRCLEEIRLEDGLQTWPRHRIEKDFGDERYWLNAISTYTRRKITFVRDRLSAVAGAAKFITRKMEDAGHPKEYLAGLWLDDSFSDQLCWAILQPKSSFQDMITDLTNEETYCAPSWSWASRNEGVAAGNSVGFTTVFRIVQYHLPPAVNDSIIAVKPGSSITLSGKLKAAPLIRPKGIVVENEEAGRFERTLDKWWNPIKNLNRVFYHLDWATDGEYTDEMAVKDKLHFLIAVQRKWQKIFGLLLLPFEGPQGVFYRRVGHFNTIGDYYWLTAFLDVEMNIL